MKWWLRRQLRAAGFDVVRYNAERFPELRRRDWISQLRIETAFDVGANTGQWAERLRSGGFQGRIVSFEPLADAREILTARSRADGAWQVYPFALGDSDAAATIHVAGNSWSSSLLAMGARHEAASPESRYIDDQQVEVRRLDALLPELRAAPPFLLKIDTQGYEMRVLRGASRTLEDARMIEVELSVPSLYEGQAEAEAIFTLLSGAGYDLVSASPAFVEPATGAVLQVDAIFLRQT